MMKMIIAVILAKAIIRFVKILFTMVREMSKLKQEEKFAADQYSPTQKACINRLTARGYSLVDALELMKAMNIK